VESANATPPQKADRIWLGFSGHMPTHVYAIENEQALTTTIEMSVHLSLPVPACRLIIKPSPIKCNKSTEEQ